MNRPTHPRGERLSTRTITIILSVMMAALGLVACETDEVDDRYATEPYGTGALEESEPEAGFGNETTVPVYPDRDPMGGLTLEESRARYGTREQQADPHIQPTDTPEYRIQEPEAMQEIGEPFDERAQDDGDLFDEPDVLFEDEPRIEERTRQAPGGSVTGSQTVREAQLGDTTDQPTTGQVDQPSPLGPLADEQGETGWADEPDDATPTDELSRTGLPEAGDRPIAAPEETTPDEIFQGEAEQQRANLERLEEEPMVEGQQPIGHDPVQPSTAQGQQPPMAADQQQQRRQQPQAGAVLRPGSGGDMAGACEQLLGPELNPAAEIDFEMMDQKQPVRLSISQPQQGAVIENDTLEVKVDLKNYRTMPDGSHVHVIVDNEPYKAFYRADRDVFEVNLAEMNLEPGAHTIRAFPARPWHESVKTPEAFATTHFFYKEKTGEPVDMSGPLLTYSRPKGTYEVTAQDNRILLDFFVANADLGPDAHKVRVTLDNKEPVTINSWMPVWMEGLSQGEHTIKLELVDAQGNVVEGPYNTTERTFTVRTVTDTAAVEEPME